MKSDPAVKAFKKALRMSTIQAIRDLDPDVRRAQEALLLDQVAELPEYRDAKTLLLYVKAFDEEIDTLPLIAKALEASRRVICPRVDKVAHQLELFEIEDLERDLEPGVLGIPEPRRTCRVVAPGEVDWVLVPGVAFDLRCNRIGRGAGHYDRFLPGVRPKVETWAIAFDCQILDPIPVESHDVPLRGVLTPAGRIAARA
ncbi:5-formyltetrahydrofolate cyclo-ligase [Paludisphaera borealis]|uniref:5-formyltetrahydrofolate cyclo-ligase n=1 Tax=Paludisphaera borealis TaxID=1387353 RepID=A0A1U7CMF6_9BACT|nr:5-formyltetrahydrofolate cyclo-ligase [Paludisphaera borealis]APW60063.1 5-formyltetrahydrofolate cyclo-ligase [Paludisphaera borealis]